MPGQEVKLGGDYSKALLVRASDQPQYDNSDAIVVWEDMHYPISPRIRRLW